MLRENFRYFSILDGASIANEDVAGDPKYYGYTRPGGSWVIMKYNVAAATYAFALGTDLDGTLTKYDAAWAVKAGLVYKRAGEFPSL